MFQISPLHLPGSGGGQCEHVHGVAVSFTYTQIHSLSPGICLAVEEDTWSRRYAVGGPASHAGRGVVRVCVGVVVVPRCRRLSGLCIFECTITHTHTHAHTHTHTHTHTLMYNYTHTHTHTHKHTHTHTHIHTLMYNYTHAHTHTFGE